MELGPLTEKVASDSNETREDYIKRMESEGFVAYYPQPNELLIDIDNSHHMAAFVRSFAILEREFPYITKSQNPSKSGTGTHVRIQMPFEMSDFERIAWQGALGSDPVRELLSCIRAKNNDAFPTLFVEKVNTI